MSRSLHLYLVAFLFFTTCLGVRAERCAVCGEEIMGDTFYIVTDKVLNEKKHLCYDCSLISDECFVCGMPVKKDYVKLSDGRFLCARDVKNAVLDSDEAKHMCEEVRDELDRLFSRFTAFPTNLNIAIVDRVNLLAIFKVPGNDNVCPDIQGYFRAKTNHSRVQYNISLMSALSRAELKATCAHELSHAWVAENVPAGRREKLRGDAEEGFCELVAYLLMESQNEEDEQKTILANRYTRGQIVLFVDAEKTYGFNDVLDWMKWGTDFRLNADEPNRIKEVEMPREERFPADNALSYSIAATPVPDTLVLRGVSGIKSHALAFINDQTLEVGESAKVRVGKTNVLVRCLAIREDSARIQFVTSGVEQELSLKKPAK